jgi:hypothetical protein
MALIDVMAAIYPKQRGGNICLGHACCSQDIFQAHQAILFWAPDLEMCVAL